MQPGPGFLALQGIPCELRVLNEKWIILKVKKRKGEKKRYVAQQRAQQMY